MRVPRLTESKNYLLFLKGQFLATRLCLFERQAILLNTPSITYFFPRQEVLQESNILGR
ncbi:MAG: hypothetical protein ACFC03_01275 [Candidatus Malihini olakiniferum]